MPFFIQIDIIMWFLFISQSSDELDIVSKSILNLIPNHISFCFIFCNSNYGSSVWFSANSFSAHWPFKEGSERVTSTNPQWTLNEPSLNPEQMKSELNSFTFEKVLQALLYFLQFGKFRFNSHLLGILAGMYSFKSKKDSVLLNLKFDI